MSLRVKNSMKKNVMIKNVIDLRSEMILFPRLRFLSLKKKKKKKGPIGFGILLRFKVSISILGKNGSY